MQIHATTGDQFTPGQRFDGTSVLPILLSMTVYRSSDKKEKLPNETRDLPSIGHKVPSFVADSLYGKICFPECFQGQWVVLFQHISSFAPVCPDDVASIYMLSDEFRRNNCELVELFCGNYERYIENFRSLKKQEVLHGVNDLYSPVSLVDDRFSDISKTFGLTSSDNHLSCEAGTFFVIDPSSIIRTTLKYPSGNMVRVFSELLRLVIAFRKNDLVMDSRSHLVQVIDRVALSL